MPGAMENNGMSRRDALKLGAGAAMLAMDAGAGESSAPRKMIGIQAGAASFVDEGTERVLDIFQEKGSINTIFLATFTYGRGIGGRQVPGQPLPDHGKQEYDLDFFGGNFATPHTQFYHGTVLKETKAPDHGDLDIIELVLDKAHRRGMKVYCWYEDVFNGRVPNIQKLAEVDLHGRRTGTLCAYNPDYRNFLIALTEDYCKSYDIDGIMWGCERQGPFNNILGSRHGGPPDPSRVSCFCEFHQAEAKQRGIDTHRAMEGYRALETLVRQALANERPGDGYFVEFWRILLKYPEVLAWQKMWTDGTQQIYGDIYGAAKGSRPSIEAGLHIWHNNSFSPFYRAEQDYESLARVADFLKVVVYNNCGGPRYAAYVNTMASTLWRDVPAVELFRFNNRLMNYQEEGLDIIPTAGLSSDYVFRETQRAVAGVKGGCKIYPGIDIDIPTGANEKKTTPEDVHDATEAALKAGADGVIFSRKYSEMRLANLEGGGKAVKEFT